MYGRLAQKRVLITQSTQFMGLMLCEVYVEQGATLVASERDLSDPQAADEVVREAMAQLGEIDVLVANLAYPAPSTPVGQVFPVCGGWVVR